MNKKTDLYWLQLFGEGSNDTGVTAGAAAQQTGVTAPPSAAQAPAAGVQEDADAADFEALIKGRYKQHFNEKVQSILRKRLKEEGKAEPAGFSQGQPDSADAFTPEVPPVQLEQVLGEWKQQEQQTRQLYPGFSMEQELQSPRFRRLILSGVDLRTAYEVMHQHQILPAAMEYAARTVEQNLARKIAAGVHRPDENGMQVRSSAYVKGDVSGFSRKDIDDVARRVARGERVTFG